MNARRILLASYHFPPDAAVGALRIAKLARLLPEFGWDVDVLTAEDRLREQGLDPDRLRGLERIPVVKTGEVPRVVELLSRVLAPLKGRRPASGATPSLVSTVPATGEIRETLSQRITRYYVSLLFLLPDEKKNWSLRAAMTAVSMIRKRRIEWVFTSGPPFSGHVIGIVAKMFTRARWVADFRDPWIDMLPERFPDTRSRVSDAIERWMESLVVRSADRVTTTTEQMRRAISARYPLVPTEKFAFLPNSIDSDRIPATAHADRYRQFTITYAGALYFDRTPEPLFQAVGELIASGRVSPSDVRIKLLGQCRSIQGVDTSVVAQRYGLGEVVEVIDRMPYSEALEVMRRSHLLLVLAPERHRLVVPAKIFDYLGTGVSVLAIAEPGATTDLIDDTGCGRWYSQSDTEGLRQYLSNALERGASSPAANEPRAFSRYDARGITSRFADMLAGNATPVRDGVMVST